jgi:hypothetical protein
MEVVNLSSGAGISKLGGAGLCLTGVLTIAFYAGTGMSPVSHHRAFPAQAATLTGLGRPCQPFIKGDMDGRDVSHGPRQLVMGYQHRLAGLDRLVLTNLLVTFFLRTCVTRVALREEKRDTESDEARRREPMI